VLGRRESDGVEEHDAEPGLDDVVDMRVLGDPLGCTCLDLLGLVEQPLAGLWELREAARVELDEPAAELASRRSKPPAAAEARAYSAITSSAAPTAACLAIGGACAQPSAVTLGRWRAR
jgi:hypothetical protein